MENANAAPVADSYQASEKAKSKNIILLSDGTGNSSRDPFKTNVWRLYQALDLNRREATQNDPDQNCLL